VRKLGLRPAHARAIRGAGGRRATVRRLGGRLTLERSAPRHRLNALLLEELLNALDRVAFIVQQASDDPQPLDVVGSIIASAAGPFEGPDLGKTRFPEAQHMLRQV